MVEKFLLDAKKSSTKIILPVDCCVTNNIETRESIKVLNINKIPKNYMGVDIGPKTIELFSGFIQSSRSIMWNGPMGVSEVDEFSNGTKQLANIIIQTTNSGCFSLIGGGDTISDVSRFGIKSKFSYVSTGGGAMLAFFKNNNLPGVLNLSSINT